MYEINPIIKDLHVKCGNGSEYTIKPSVIGDQIYYLRGDCPFDVLRGNNGHDTLYFDKLTWSDVAVKLVGKGRNYWYWSDDSNFPKKSTSYSVLFEYVEN